MRKLAQLFRAYTGFGLVLAVAATGCAQVLGIEDWSETQGGGGAGGDTTSTSTTGSGGPASSSAGTGMGDVEICDNGIDDDADGKADCADSDCGSYACVALAPPGWQGPVELLEGDVLPECRDGWATSAGLGSGQLTALPATCSPCDCDHPAGGSCNLQAGASLNVFPMTQCGSTPVSYMFDTPGQCVKIADGTTSLTTSVKPEAQVTLTKGSCQPTGGAATLTEPFFEQNARGCEPPAVGAGCAEDNVCMPQPPPLGSICIYSQNPMPGATCPPEYPSERVLSSIKQDTRGCSACTCGAAAGQMCGASVFLYSDDVCTTALKEVANLVCSDVPSPKSFKAQVYGPAGGMCAPAGGDPIGEVVLDTTILCCK